MFTREQLPDCTIINCDYIIHSDASENILFLVHMFYEISVIPHFGINNNRQSKTAVSLKSINVYFVYVYRVPRCIYFFKATRQTNKRKDSLGGGVKAELT